MCARKKDSDLAVRMPEARRSLDAWVATLDAETRRRGKKYYENGHVLTVWADADHRVEAEVEGQDVYATTLSLNRGQWSSACTCPMEAGCKHAVAAALAWIAAEGVDFATQEEEDNDYGFPPSSTPRASTPGATKKSAFRETWTPVIAKKLGRALTADEGRQLGQLSALFARFTQGWGHLGAHDLMEFGFGGAIPPGVNQWKPLFHGWWDPQKPPRDPWELWQYLAYSLERNGRPIPEVFQACTDLAAVRTALDQRMLREELERWRIALRPAEPGQRYTRANPLAGVAGLRVRVDRNGALLVESRAGAAKPWKSSTQTLFRNLANALGGDLAHLPPAEQALGMLLATDYRAHLHGFGVEKTLPAETAGRVLASEEIRPALVMADGSPPAFAPEPLVREAMLSAAAGDRLELRLITADGRDAAPVVPVTATPEAYYLFENRLWRGPPAVPAATLPVAALADPQLALRLHATGLRLPSSLELKVRRIALRPQLKCWIDESQPGWPAFYARLIARSADPACAQEWRGAGGWQWVQGEAPRARRRDDPLLEFDLADANTAGARFAEFRLGWAQWHSAWTRPLSKNFPEEFLAWHATLPPGLDIDASPEIAALFGAPLRAHMDFSAIAADSSHDWFDLTVALRVEDTALTPDEIALLLKARGKWVRLPKGGWRRLELAGAETGTPAAAALDRLGLTADDVFATGKSATHRLHALQLAGEAAALESRDAKLAAALRERVATLATRPPPPLPGGLTATLRPYQVEGFHFLAHLAAQGFGGVLADDMGLGKTVQTLAWLLHLRDAAKEFRALVVCPKSVTHGWLAETERFAPALKIEAFTPALATAPHAACQAQLLVANYTQLRIHAGWFAAAAWDAVVLDEGQFIKNPTSQAAVAARALPTRQRLILTGTPVENRLTDLWSLFAFAQPGLLGAQAAFRRQYDEKDPAALARLHRRVRHFLLRRTKGQAAPDLPPRTEDDLVVELEPAQRKLYDAELKRARAQLLGIETARALDKVRFNILASLLRLRQICCHPALVDPAHAALPSAKLDALLERLEELHEEGHQVLVFSQFVEMLEIIRARLAAAGIGHLILTGATENRAALVAEFQRDKTKTVFLLSLKAAGFGLNLTAASYAILYDPWWNPAVEAQAIDRTHRIGQTRPVIAYRLLADNTVEQKIRALQKEKAALAAAVVQEESLASVLDLDSLRRILA